MYFTRWRTFGLFRSLQSETMKLLIDARNVTDATAVPGWHRIQGASRGWLNGDGTINRDRVRVDMEAYPERKVLVIENELIGATDPRQLEIVDLVREVRPEIRLGFYGHAPIRDYWSLVIDDASREQAWRSKNAELARGRGADGRYTDRGLIDSVDILFASLYTFYPRSAGSWHGREHDDLWFSHFAPKMIDVARRWQKPVVPYLWFRYHTTLEPLALDMFRRQIELCLDLADGCVIWGWSGHDATHGQMFPAISELMKEFV